MHQNAQFSTQKSKKNSGEGTPPSQHLSPIGMANIEMKHSNWCNFRLLQSAKSSTQNAQKRSVFNSEKQQTTTFNDALSATTRVSQYWGPCANVHLASNR